MSNKLCLVKCRGMRQSNINGVAYVVANDPTEAYNKLRSFLDKNKIGFKKERELFTIELLAESADYPDCGIRLFL